MSIARVLRNRVSAIRYCVLGLNSEGVNSSISLPSRAPVRLSMTHVPLPSKSRCSVVDKGFGCLGCRANQVPATAASTRLLRPKKERARVRRRIRAARREAGESLPESFIDAWRPPNESRLSCGRNAWGRKAVQRQTKGWPARQRNSSHKSARQLQAHVRRLPFESDTASRPSGTRAAISDPPPVRSRHRRPP
jgi:hypothetical protein